MAASKILMEAFIRVTVFAFIVWVSFNVYRDMQREVVIIDPFSVPKRFAEVGLTPEVISSRIGDMLQRLEATTETGMKKDTLAFARDEGTTPDVEIPGIKLGLKTVVELTRSVLGRDPKHISGDIVLPEHSLALGQATVTLYIVQGKKRSAPVGILVPADDVVALIERAAEGILGEVNPYLLGVILVNRGEYEKAIAISQRIFQDPSQTRA